jgi:HEAT repeat protein
MRSSLAGLACLATLMGAATAPSFGQEGKTPDSSREAKLIAVLKSDAPRKDKAEACRLLARVGTKQAVPTLAALLTDENLAHMARYALEPISDPAVDVALRDALGKVNGRLRVGVIGSLGVRQDTEAVGPLSALLKDDDPAVAQAAARALGSIGNPAAAEALEGAWEGKATPPAKKLAIAEGLFRCVDRLSAHGQRERAVAICDRLLEEQAPAQVREGATRKARLLRQEQAKGL